MAGKLDEAIMAGNEAIRLKSDFAPAHFHRGLALRERGDLREAIDAFRNASRFDPGIARFHNALAWELATSADHGLRNPAEALESARKAVQLAPSDGKYWSTLGVAQYRMGDWNAAIAALEKSMALNKEGDSVAWFFLAMVHWQLGRQDEARKLHDEAVRWMDQHQPKNEELRRFREEAEQLLRGERCS
jgi:tetratricopeptide (TPR) repeat protein